MATSSVDLPLEEILSPKFKPESLTKPQLRSLLAEYSGLPVAELPAASAKKEVYLTFFDHYLTRRRNQLLKRVKPEGKGIVLVNKDGSMNTTTGTPVKSTASRRKVEFDMSSGYFSDENTFQSPGKGAKGPATRRTSRRLKQLGSEDEQFVTKSDAEDYQKSPTKRAPRSKKGRTASKEHIEHTEIQPLQPEPLKKQLHHDHKHEHPHQPKRRVKIPSFIWKFSIFFSFVSILFLYLHFLSLVPICPSGETCTAKSINDWIFAPWRRIVRSQPWLQLFPLQDEPYFCWTCPLYANCATDRRTGITTVHCHAGFKLYQPWGGLFGPVCKPDPKQQSAVDALAQNVEKFLSERLGEAICSSIGQSGASFASLPAKISSISELDESCRTKAVFSEEFVRSHFKNVPGPWKEESKYDAFFDLVMKKLSKSTPPIIIIGKPKDGKLVLCASTPSYPLSCIIGFNIGSTIKGHWMHISLIIFIVGTLLYLKRLSGKRRELHRISAQIGEAVVTKLVEQEYLNRSDPMTYPSTVPVNQLRDGLLVNLSEKDKKYVWKSVSGSIQRNSNIRESVTTLKGDQHRVWEWVGPEVLSPTKRR